MSRATTGRWRGSGWLAVLAMLALALPAAGQQAADGRRVYQEQLRVQLDQQQAAAREAGLDAGGWFSFAIFNYDDASARTVRTLRQYQLRLWGSYTAAGVHTLYVRGLSTFSDWNSGTNPNSHQDDQFREAELERAWYRFDYNRLVRNQTGQTPPAGFVIQVGRDFYQLGSGLVLALPLDAVQVTGNLGDWEVTGLLGKTILHTPNIDDSEAVRDHMDRCFYGLQVKWTGFSRHEPFAYFLWQRDRTDEWGEDPDHRYEYDSRYFGLGSAGTVLAPNLRYSAEVAFQGGRSYPEQADARREEIHAMAVDVLLEYLFNVPCRPKVNFEYLWGSGDADRRLSANSTIGGNQAGTRDEAFNAFGFRDTGLAFAPRLANLHIFALGASAFPLEQVALLKQLEVGSKVYFYARQAASGAISDTTATQTAQWVGWEWDAFCNWRITSDLSLTLRYGAFQPGAAFENNDCRQFLYAGVTYSF